MRVGRKGALLELLGVSLFSVGFLSGSTYPVWPSSSCHFWPLFLRLCLQHSFLVTFLSLLDKIPNARCIEDQCLENRPLTQSLHIYLSWEEERFLRPWELRVMDGQSMRVSWNTRHSSFTSHQRLQGTKEICLPLVFAPELQGLSQVSAPLQGATLLSASRDPQLWT